MAARRTDKKREPKTCDPLQHIRRELQRDSAVKPDHRRAEDRFRDERHDAHAVTIRAERRRGRSENELRALRDQLEREWKAQQPPARSATKKSKVKS